jgi:tetratricopeptide (TPR) repeat protein
VALGLLAVGLAAALTWLWLRRAREASVEPSRAAAGIRIRTGAAVTALAFLIAGAGSLVYWAAAGPPTESAFYAYVNKGHAARAAEDLPRALTSYKRALAVARQRADSDLEVEALDSVASVYFQLQDYEKALEIYRREVDVLDSLPVEPRLQKAHALSRMAACYTALGETELADRSKGYADPLSSGIHLDSP